MKELFWKLTGGRPMIRIGFAFTDVVSGQGVDYYVDRFGHHWLANRPWSRFRVSVEAGND